MYLGSNTLGLILNLNLVIDLIERVINSAENNIQGNTANLGPLLICQCQVGTKK